MLIAFDWFDVDSGNKSFHMAFVHVGQILNAMPLEAVHELVSHHTVGAQQIRAVLQYKVCKLTHAILT